MHKNLIALPFGNASLSAEIPSSISTMIAQPVDLQKVQNDSRAIEYAIRHPIGAKRLSHTVRSTDKIVIIVDDITRPVPTKKILPPLLNELHKGGIRNEQVTILVATGVHRPNTKEEMDYFLGKRITDSLNSINHNCRDKKNLVFIGTTKKGIPIEINKIAAEADVKILTGLIEPHHVAGYSGGRKSILPGIAGLDTIRIHHSFPFMQYDPAIGKLRGNPFHEEAIGAAMMVKVDFICNVVLNIRNEIVKVVAGDLIYAWLEGVKASEKMCKTRIAEHADIVITSPGGYPRDINLWQSQKALSPAEQVVKRGGVIVLVAQCREGVGGHFDQHFKGVFSSEQVIDKFQQKGFTPDGGLVKAFLYARALQKAHIFAITQGVSRKKLEKLFTTPASTLEEALRMATRLVGEKPKILIMPSANKLVPLIG